MRTLTENEVAAVSGGDMTPLTNPGDIHVPGTLDMNDLFPIPDTYEPIPVN